MISSKNERVFIGDLSDLTLLIIVDAWWASVSVGSKHCIASNNSWHAPLWRFYFHCRIEESSRPGITCIICGQVLRHPPEHVTSSMGKHLLAEGQTAKWRELTESEVTKLTTSMVDETALAILLSQGSQVCSIVSSQRKLVFDMQILSILTELTEKTLQTGCEGLSKCEIAPRPRELLPHVRICFGTSYTECYIKSRATTVVQCIKERFGATVRQHAEQPSPERIYTGSGCNWQAIAFKKCRWFSSWRLDIDERLSHNFGHCLQYGYNLDIVYNITRIRWGWWLALVPFGTLIRIIGQKSSYWSMASHTFERCSWTL